MPERQVLFRGKRFDVVRALQALPDGSLHAREIVRHPGAVAILPLLEGDRVCLIENFRASVGRVLHELPAGTLESGEEPIVAAARELAEETGMRARRLELLATFYTSPGVLDERMHLYLATELVEGPSALEAGEEIRNLIVSWREALRMVRDGRIEDAKTLVGLLFYETQRRSGQ